MGGPKRKEISVISPDILREAIKTRIRELDGRTYKEKRPCPNCGATSSYRNGFRERIIAKLITEGGFRKVKIKVQKLVCKECGDGFCAKAPIYPGCDYGKPIVDLALYLSMFHRPPTVEDMMKDMGIQLDRDTIARYKRLFADRVKEQAEARPGMTVNILKTLTGARNVDELKRKLGEEGVEREEIMEAMEGKGEGEEGEREIVGMADETFPTEKGAKKEYKEEKRRAKAEGESPPPYPDSHTLVFSYLPQLKIFASILVIGGLLDKELAKELLSPLKGVDRLITDGWRAYPAAASALGILWVCCTIHKRKAILRKLESLRELKEKDPKAFREEYKEYLEELKEEAREKIKEKTGEKPPPDALLSTNPLEERNRQAHRQMGDAVGVFYWTEEGVLSQAILSAIYESAKTYRRGKPFHSVCSEFNHFSYERVMKGAPLSCPP